MLNSTTLSLTGEAIARTAILGTIVYIGGLIGNLLSLTIFVRTEIRRVSTGILFLFLTISNTIQLITLTLEFIDAAYNVRLFHSVFIRCRFVYWLQNIFRSLSSFIVCTITIDRMIRATHPLRAKYYCTRRFACRIVLIYLIILAFSLGFYLLPYITEDADEVCSTKSNPTYNIFMSSIWPPIRTVVVGILPLVVMIISNIQLWRRIRASKRRVFPHLSYFSFANNNERMFLFIAISNVLVFTITQIPFHLYTSIVAYKNSIDHVRTPMLLWSSIYFGIGFYIYCLISRNFRSKFFLTMPCFAKKESIVTIRRNTIS